MNMAEAIAASTGNKARAYSDTGRVVIVQERWSGVTDSWLHVWEIRSDGVVGESDIPLPRPVRLQTSYLVDPDAGYWSAVYGMHERAQ